MLCFGFYTRDDDDDFDRNENFERDHKQVISFMYSHARRSIFVHLYFTISIRKLHMSIFTLLYIFLIYTHLLTCLHALDAYFAGG